ncbi:GGDEF domain-containing protein [Azospirillum sp.]|uniref:GGDEF domain-containing protein n=1 Tax=Azospirillum sp. TaxID=34012 RepID=UPI002D5549E4|nr:GGDEF domain-containing protein [Azospirillum sp.]HYD67648.1 GGDEF domain-containing protein [Azospirillum sp.]
MILDSRTLVVVTLLMALVMAAAHLLTWHVNRGIRSLRYAVVCDVLVAVAVLLVTMRGPEPSLWTMAATNAAFVGAYVSIYLAIRSFTKSHVPGSWIVALVMVYVSLIALSIAAGSINGRLATATGFVCVMCLLCGVDLLRNARWAVRTSAGVVGLVFLGHAAFAGLRSASTILENPLPDLLAPSMVQSLGFLEAIGAMLAFGIGFIVMTTERLQADLRQAATYDSLTGIFNRSAFLALAESTFARAHRSGEAFALLLIDIDHFKRINDSFGHQAGDTVLRAFTAAVTAELRQGDVFGRYGGEEFCVLLPGTRMDGALIVAERLRVTLRDLLVEHEGNVISTSVSIGAADTQDAPHTFDEMLAEADRALYRAKATGRDRVVAAGLVPA